MAHAVSMVRTQFERKLMLQDYQYPLDAFVKKCELSRDRNEGYAGARDLFISPVAQSLFETDCFSGWTQMSTGENAGNSSEEIPGL